MKWIKLVGATKDRYEPRSKAERVFTEYDNFLNFSDPTDRPTRLDMSAVSVSLDCSLSASYIFWTKLPIGKWFSSYLKATFDKSFALA